MKLELGLATSHLEAEKGTRGREIKIKNKEY